MIARGFATFAFADEHLEQHRSIIFIANRECNEGIRLERKLQHREALKRQRLRYVAHKPNHRRYGTRTMAGGSGRRKADREEIDENFRAEAEVKAKKRSALSRDEVAGGGKSHVASTSALTRLNFPIAAQSAKDITCGEEGSAF
jgi:hypothetical protein